IISAGTIRTPRGRGDDVAKSREAHPKEKAFDNSRSQTDREPVINLPLFPLNGATSLAGRPERLSGGNALLT
ncbi:hypothetical protein KUCAC02_020618, partial [Chaenocephalus aceratus]